MQPEQHSRPVVVEALRRARVSLRHAFRVVAPGPRAWRGASLGMALAVTIVLIGAGLAFASGRGPVIDVLTALAVGWLLIAGVGGGLLLFGLLLRWIPPPVRALGLAATLLLGYLLRVAGPWAFLVAALLLLVAALVGAGALSLAARRKPHPLQRAIATGGLVIGLMILVVSGAWLLDDGAVDDPGSTPTGPHEVRTLTYGSGSHPWRAEFGEAVDVPTRPVDGSALLEGWNGWGGTLRSDFWGFGPDALPLNATVWYPEAAGPFPLVLIVHGNARMELPSDLGYAWLAEDLASHGYVVASIDQNFINSSITRFDVGGEYDARAWLLLEHLRQWQEWQSDPGSPLHGLADLERVALVGHSRGGEAVATAAYFNRLQRYPENAMVTFHGGFGIRSVIALSPSDTNYQPAGRPTPLIDTSYLVIQGGLDADHFAFHGLRQYHRATFSDGRFGVRSAVYLPDANHGQFNTEWGRWDAVGPARLLLDAGSIMPPAEQRSIGRGAIIAFLEATLRDSLDALTLLHDRDHSGWGTVQPILRYADSTEVTIVGFHEDADPATGTLPGTRIEAHGLAVWREGPAPLRLAEQGSNVAVLGWSTREDGDVPWLSIQLPEDWTAPAEPVLALSLADSGNPPPGEDVSHTGPIELTVELIDAAGSGFRVSLAELGGVPPARALRLLKSPLPSWTEPFEPIAHTFRIPLDHSRMDSSQLREVRLIFDGSPVGLVHLTGLSIGTETLSVDH